LVVPEKVKSFPLAQVATSFFHHSFVPGGQN